MTDITGHKAPEVLPSLDREERTRLLEVAVLETWKAAGDPVGRQAQETFDVRVHLRFAMLELFERENRCWAERHGAECAEAILLGCAE